jgi:hypothetical protein
MTRRICSGCGHTLVQPAADVDGVMGEHMDAHTRRHVQRGEMSVWVVDATPDAPARLGWQLVVGAAAAAIIIAILAIVTGPPADSSYRDCVDAFQLEVGAVTDYDRADCRDGVADGKW